MLAAGLVSTKTAIDTLQRLGPTLAFLAAMFVLSHLADAAGLFTLASQGLAAVITVGCRYLAPLAQPGTGGPAEQSAAGPGPARAETWLMGCGLGAILAAFVIGSVGGIEPSLIAVLGAAGLAGIGLCRQTVRIGDVARSVDVAFLGFVGTLGIVVAAPAQHGLTEAVAQRLPDGQGLGALLVVAFGAALVANVVTNLSATLVLLPALAGQQPALLLAALIRVNIGPNLTVTGSLATLLWRRVVRGQAAEPPRRSFIRVGLVTTPLAIAGATTALWATLRLLN